MRKPTIYEALAAKLGRNPTDAELKADVQRIKDEVLVTMAAGGKLRHQRRSSRSGHAPAGKRPNVVDGNTLPILDTGTLTYLARVPFWSQLEKDGSTYFCKGAEKRLPAGTTVERIGGDKGRPLVRAWYADALWYAWLMPQGVDWHKKGQLSLTGA